MLSKVASRTRLRFFPVLGKFRFCQDYSFLRAVDISVDCCGRRMCKFEVELPSKVSACVFENVKRYNVKTLIERAWQTKGSEK